jgi:hypothetical protein
VQVDQGIGKYFPIYEMNIYIFDIGHFFKIPMMVFSASGNEHFQATLPDPVVFFCVQYSD